MIKFEKTTCMIVVTGAAGFIGSCMIARLNESNFNNIIAVDVFQDEFKNQNLAGKKLRATIDREAFLPWLDENAEAVEFIFHLGAHTDTTEQDTDILRKLNTDYSKAIWKRCVDEQIPLIYASSAATYGAGENGFSDDENTLESLKPLNAYGQSKQEFDLWAISQEQKPFFWAGLKFFNVYGPNEYHKERMASVVYHSFHKIIESNTLKLFKSHRSDFEDGEQKRDFLYVKDAVEVMYWLMHHRKNSGIYNIGTGEARSFNSLATAIFKSLGLESKVEYVDTPEDIREKYQYFTEADIKKIKSIGYPMDFTTLEAGVDDYIKNYLLNMTYY